MVTAPQEKERLYSLTSEGIAVFQRDHVVSKAKPSENLVQSVNPINLTYNRMYAVLDFNKPIIPIELNYYIVTGARTFGDNHSRKPYNPHAFCVKINPRVLIDATCRGQWVQTEEQDEVQTITLFNQKRAETSVVPESNILFLGEDDDNPISTDMTQEIVQYASSRLLKTTGFSRKNVLEYLDACEAKYFREM
ncbi:hypothetical protein GEMRC1_009500 [Eukaryota sp. GEM-RC1]